MLKQFDPMSPEFRANPYPYYDFMRTGMPVFMLDDWQMWFCTRHEDCSALLRDSRLGYEILRVMTLDELGWRSTEELPDNRAKLQRTQRRWMLFRDPPDHTRLRGLVHKAFTPRMIEKLRSHIEDIAHSLLDAVQAKGEMELMADFATQLPVIVIAEMLGIPVEDREQFRALSNALAGTLDLVGAEGDAIFEAASDAAVELDEYMRGLADQRRKAPQDDLLTALVEAEEEGDKLTEDEVISTIILLLVAGHETTVNLIGNGAYALLTHPDQFALLKEDPAGLVKSAVEEMLRYDSPVQMTRRWVMEDMEYEGNAFKKGQQVATLFGAANRDPERFDHPNTFDITRENNKHLAFGAGIHFCIGAPLARMEGQITFKTLCERMPNLQLATDELSYRRNYILRGLNALPVTF